MIFTSHPINVNRCNRLKLLNLERHEPSSSCGKVTTFLIENDHSFRKTKLFKFQRFEYKEQNGRLVLAEDLCISAQASKQSSITTFNKQLEQAHYLYIYIYGG